jgi:hypothetical protein
VSDMDHHYCLMVEVIHHEILAQKKFGWQEVDMKRLCVNSPKPYQLIQWYSYLQLMLYDLGMLLVAILIIQVSR